MREIINTVYEETTLQVEMGLRAPGFHHSILGSAAVAVCLLPLSLRLTFGQPLPLLLLWLRFAGRRREEKDVPRIKSRFPMPQTCAAATEKWFPVTADPVDGGRCGNQEKKSAVVVEKGKKRQQQ